MRLFAITGLRQDMKGTLAQTLIERISQRGNTLTLLDNSDDPQQWEAVSRQRLCVLFTGIGIDPGRVEAANRLQHIDHLLVCRTGTSGKAAEQLCWHPRPRQHIRTGG